MRKAAAIFFALMTFSLILSGCEAPRQVVIGNQCVGSWIQLIDGRGNVVIPYLQFGGVAHVNLDRMYSGEVLLFANAFSLEDSHPLGADVRYYSVDKGEFRSYPTGPQYGDWIITSLQTTASNGGCRNPDSGGSDGGPVYGNPAW